MKTKLPPPCFPLIWQGSGAIKAGRGRRHAVYPSGCDGWDFVPNISFGIPVIKSIRKHSNMVFDAHLMIVEPEKYVEEFRKAGADIINFHVEATKYPQR